MVGAGNDKTEEGTQVSCAQNAQSSELCQLQQVEIRALLDKLSAANITIKQKDVRIGGLLNQLGRRAANEKGKDAQLTQEKQINSGNQKIIDCLEDCINQCGLANMCASNLLSPDSLPDINDPEAVCSWLHKITSAITKLSRLNVDLTNDVFAKTNLSSHHLVNKPVPGKNTPKGAASASKKVAEMTLTEQRARLAQKIEIKTQLIEHMSAQQGAKSDELLHEVEALKRLNERLERLDEKIASSGEDEAADKPAGTDGSSSNVRDEQNEQDETGNSGKLCESSEQNGQAVDSLDSSDSEPDDGHQNAQCSQEDDQKNDDDAKKDETRATHPCPNVPEHAEVRYRFHGCCYDPKAHKIMPAWELPSHERIKTNVAVCISVIDDVQTVVSELKFKGPDGGTMEINPGSHSDLKMTAGDDDAGTTTKTGGKAPAATGGAGDGTPAKADSDTVAAGTVPAGDADTKEPTVTAGSDQQADENTASGDGQAEAATADREAEEAPMEHYVEKVDGIVKEIHHYKIPLPPFKPSPEDLAAYECRNITLDYKKAHNKFGFSDELLERLTVYKGGELFDPIKYQGWDEAMYLARPLFVGNSLSQGAMVSALTQYGLCYNSKSRIYDLFSGIGNFDMSREQFVLLVNMSIRCFLSGVADVIHEELLSRAKVLQIDESPFTVRHLRRTVNPNSESEGQSDVPPENPETTEGEDPGDEPAGKPFLINNRAKCYVWALTSGPHEEYQAVYYHPGRRRTYKELCNALQLSCPPTPEECRNFTPEALMSDGYTCYRTLARDINNVLKAEGREFIAANCLSHAHTKLVEAIRGFGQLDVFNRACIKEGATEFFSKRLERIYREETGKELTFISKETMVITFTIDEIFSHERGFYHCKMPDSDLTMFRQGEQKLFDILFSRCKRLVKTYPQAFNSRINKDGRMVYTTVNGLGWPDAIAYLLNRETEFRNILRDGRLPVHDNDSERSIRTFVVSKHTQLFLNSEIGYKGFCTLMTLYETCKKTNVNFENYLSWVINCVKHRLENYRMESGITTQMLLIPKERKREVTDADGKVVGEELIDLYDKSEPLFYDKIDYHGLTPKDYWALFLRDKRAAKVEGWLEKNKK